jgi:hypothetical protein
MAEHREDAGHQVQQQPAEQREQHRLPEGQRGTGGGRAGDRRRDLEGGALAAGVAQHHRARQRLRPRAVQQRDAERQRAVPPGGGLRRGVVHHPRRMGKEEGVLHQAGREAGAGDRQAGLPAGRAGARRPGRLPRQARGVRLEQRRGDRGGHGRAGHRQRQGEAAFLGDADLLADQPGRLGLDAEGLAGERVAGTVTGTGSSTSPL